MSAVTVPKKKGESFLWTEAEIELLLESVKVFASNCLFNGTDWEGVKTKYDKIREIFVERYPKVKDGETEEEPNSDYPKSKSLEQVTKERIAAKLKTVRGNFKKAVDSGRRSGGGRVVMTYYDLCHDIWAGAPSTKSIDGGIDSSSAQEKDEKSSTKDRSEFPMYNNSDDEIEALFGISGEEEDTQGIPNAQNPINRREKIAEYLKNEKEKRMNTKVPVNKQHLALAREDLALKRKMMETSDKVDQQFISNTSKMAKTMENVGNSISCCFDLMKKMYEATQANVPPAVHGNVPHPQMPVYPDMRGLQYFTSNCFEHIHHTTVNRREMVRLARPRDKYVIVLFLFVSRDEIVGHFREECNVKYIANTAFAMDQVTYF